MSSLKLLNNYKCFNGFQRIYQHSSDELKVDMKFAIYLPSTFESSKLPVLIWLSGLTCNEQNFITKSGFHRYAEENKIIVVAPDTSPRGLDIEGIRDSWDFGEGAGFYVDATEEKWKTNFRMYSYINKELHEVIKNNFNCDQNSFGIFGHSMGGHGALISFLQNSSIYKSCSAFAPICNPSNCNWGIKALTNYIGSDHENWKVFDATHLASNYIGKQVEILVDQGVEDSFLKDKQLLPESLASACQDKQNLIKLHLNYREGYDHSYYFISSFIEEHFKFHSKFLH